MISTGFTELDEITGGLRRGELTVIAGRPSMGKTTLCRSIAENIVRNGQRTCIVAISGGQIGTVRLFDMDTCNALYPIASMNEIINRVKSQCYRGNFDVVFFTALYPANRTQAIDIYGSLKDFATAENIAVVVEAAAHRKVDRLESRRPDIEHLRNPATVNKYADNIWLIYRDSYYDPEIADLSALEVIVAKNSSAKLGTAHLNLEFEETPIIVRIPRINERQQKGKSNHYEVIAAPDAGIGARLRC